MPQVFLPRGALNLGAALEKRTLCPRAHLGGSHGPIRRPGSPAPPTGQPGSNFGFVAKLSEQPLKNENHRTQFIALKHNYYSMIH